ALSVSSTPSARPPSPLHALRCLRTPFAASARHTPPLHALSALRVLSTPSVRCALPLHPLCCLRTPSTASAHRTPPPHALSALRAWSTSCARRPLPPQALLRLRTLSAAVPRRICPPHALCPLEPWGCQVFSLQCNGARRALYAISLPRAPLPHSAPQRPATPHHVRCLGASDTFLPHRIRPMRRRRALRALATADDARPTPSRCVIWLRAASQPPRVPSLRPARHSNGIGSAPYATSLRPALSRRAARLHLTMQVLPSPATARVGSRPLALALAAPVTLTLPPRMPRNRPLCRRGALPALATAQDAHSNTFVPARNSPLCRRCTLRASATAQGVHFTPARCCFTPAHRHFTPMAPYTAVLRLHVRAAISRSAAFLRPVTVPRTVAAHLSNSARCTFYGHAPPFRAPMSTPPLRAPMSTPPPPAIPPPCPAPDVRSTPARRCFTPAGRRSKAARPPCSLPHRHRPFLRLRCLVPSLHAPLLSPSTPSGVSAAPRLACRLQAPPRHLHPASHSLHPTDAAPRAPPSPRRAAPSTSPTSPSQRPATPSSGPMGPSAHPTPPAVRPAASSQRPAVPSVSHHIVCASPCAL
ncbi:hypothetical protein DENSPDRAFT_886709, partial [Dentipellis sp. KUC8613]